jgi:hypothetical protein
MDDTNNEISSNDHVILNDEKLEELSHRIDTAFQIALGKLLDSNGNIETVLQTGEAFGRGVFNDYITEKLHEWTIEEWIQSMVNQIFTPLGSEFIVSKMTDVEVTSVLTKNPLQKFTDEPNVISLFTYGFLRGLLKSAFPEGELLMGESQELQDTRMTKFVFKSQAFFTDKFERERVKSSFNITKKL